MVYPLSVPEVKQYFKISGGVYFDWWENGTMDFEIYEMYCNDASAGLLTATISEVGEKRC